MADKVHYSSINAHKKMAGADQSGGFGVGKGFASAGSHPDVGMKHDPMDDGARMPAVKGGNGMMQGAPDHGVGKGYRDHFQRDGKA